MKKKNKGKAKIWLKIRIKKEKQGGRQTGKQEGLCLRTDSI